MFSVFSDYAAGICCNCHGASRCYKVRMSEQILCPFCVIYFVSFPDNLYSDFFILFYFIDLQKAWNFSFDKPRWHVSNKTVSATWLSSTRSPS